MLVALLEEEEEHVETPLTVSMESQDEFECAKCGEGGVTCKDGEAERVG